MTMELEDELDVREIQRGQFELVAVFRDLASGESLRLNLDQVNRVLSGDMNEVHDTSLTQETLRQGRDALLAAPPRP